MGAYSTTVNTSILIDLPFDYSDNGWTISGGKATHGGCNPGYIRLIDTGLLPNTEYVIEYEVSDYVSGFVKVIAGGVSGANIAENGTVTETITTGADGTLMFYATGVVSIEYLDYYLASESIADNSVTLVFNEGGDKFLGEASFKPEMMVKFIDGFYTSKDGELWEHDVNPVRNNYYGTQYSSKVRFVSNPDYNKEKLWFNIRLDSKGNWSAPSLLTPENDKFPNGMESRLKKGNFKEKDGKKWADILRDISDPKYAILPEVERLYKARMMQGAYLVVELECADTTEAKLASAEVYYIEVERAL